MASKYHGNCACGAVELAVSTTPGYQIYCHCQDCQLAHTCSYISGYGVPRHLPSGESGLEVTRGKDLVDHYFIREEAPAWKLCFCKKCGTRLYYDMDRYQMFATFPVLFPDMQFQPTSHVFYSRAKARIMDDLPKYKDVPEPFGSGVLMEN